MREGSPAEEFGPYLVYEQLGVGGMAQVHRAIAKGSDPQRPLALKRMLAHIASNQEMVKSFVREARLANYLRHPNVPRTYDLGRVGDVYFIAMELITGRNLREVLQHCARTTGPMPVRIALNILNQICDALDYAHNLCDDTGEPLGIVHRDVSPSNVIVSETGVVKLIDFGIAKGSAASMQTMSGTLKGKFAYMAPEYFAGQIDARADLWAIGVIAHELLTNRPLFSGRDDVDTMKRVSSMALAPPSQKNPRVPPEIDDIVMTALARDPDRRWQHATALRTALTTLTRRLDQVATNAEVVQWLDWAFTQVAGEPPSSDRPGADTAVDAPQIRDDPSISIEVSTAQILAPITDPGSGPAVTVRGSAPGPGAMAGVIPDPAVRSSPIPVPPAPPAPAPVDAPVPLPPVVVSPSARPGATVLGTSAPAIRATAGSAAPGARAARITSPPGTPPNAAPMSAALLAHLNAAHALAASGAPANVAHSPISAANAVPVRPTSGSEATAAAAPAFPAASEAPRRNRRLRAIVLVAFAGILAAVLAAIAAYFVLPLLI